jgi:hypothetical protein
VRRPLPDAASRYPRRAAAGAAMSAVLTTSSMNVLRNRPHLQALLRRPSSELRESRQGTVPGWCVARERLQKGVSSDLHGRYGGVH